MKRKASAYKTKYFSHIGIFNLLYASVDSIYASKYCIYDIVSGIYSHTV